MVNSTAGLYAVTAQKPTIVTFAVTGSFTSATEQNLILARCNRIEIFGIYPEGLKGVLDVPVYGRIAAMQVFRPPHSSKDLLMVLTHRYKLVILEYDEVAREIRTRATGDVSSRIARPADAGMLAFIDPDCRCIGLHLYDGLVKIVPITEQGEFLEAFDLRIEELMVKDMRFLHGRARPTLAYIFEDSRELRHAKTVELSIKDKDLLDGPWSLQHLDNGASMLLPLPQPAGGALVVGENVLTYAGPGQQPVAIPSPYSAVFRAACMVDPDGSRFFLSDHVGRMYVLGVSQDQGRVTGIRLEPIGLTSPGECLAYLDNGVVFVGSVHSDSQLVQVHAEPVNGYGEKPPSYVSVLDTWQHVGPIQDMCIVDTEGQGQGQIVTCSGVQNFGSIRVIRSGIGITEQAALPLEGMKGVWALRDSDQSEFDQLLVVTFVGETRVLMFTDESELDEVEPNGFEGARQTLLCQNLDGNLLLQVTTASVRLLRASTRDLAAEWRPEDGREITLATASPTQVLVASRGGHVAYLEVDGARGTVALKASRKLEAEVSCLDTALLTPEEERARAARTCAAGLWSGRVELLELPSLQQRAVETVGAEGGVIPRSCALVTFEEGHTVLLAALGDGQVCSYTLDPATAALSSLKKVPLGTKPLALRRFYLGANVNVFAASDRPAVIYSVKKKLLFSAVNTSEVLFMTSFHCPGYPNCLALAKAGALTIGNIDEIQKLHVRSIPLHEQPRRITFHEPSGTFVVTTIEFRVPPPGSAQNAESQQSWIRLLDATTFELLDSFPLDMTEEPQAVTSVALEDSGAGAGAGAGAAGGSGRSGQGQPLVAVGTAYVLPEQDQPTRGRILLFEIKDGKLVHVGFRETKGSVWALEGFQGKLLSSVNHRVYLHRASLRAEEGVWELLPECSYQGHTLSLYLATRGDQILVGDLMKSVSLLQYRPDEASFDDRARDFNPEWTTAVQFIDEDTYVAAENCFNLYVTRKNSDAANDEERCRLDVIGEFGLCYFVNRIRPGSIVMKLPDAEASFGPSLVFGTVEGAVGLLVPLNKEQFELLDRVQQAMAQDAPGVGSLLHKDYRQFNNDMAAPRDSRGFVDGDLVEAFLDMGRERQEKLLEMVGSVNGPVALGDVIKLIEDLARMH